MPTYRIASPRRPPDPATRPAIQRSLTMLDLCVLSFGLLTLSTARAQAPTPLQAARPTPHRDTTEAQPASEVEALNPEARVMAREFAVRGAEAYDQGRYQEALEQFDRAASIVIVPSIAVMQARTLVKLNRWIEALDQYQQTARVKLEPDAPEPFHQAVRECFVEAAALRKRIPQISLLLTAQTNPGVTVYLDEKLVHSALLNVPRLADPGQHTISAHANGKQFFQRAITLEPGQKVEIHISPPTPQTPVATPTSPTPLDPTSVADNSATEPNWPLITAISVGALGVVGVVATAIAGTAHKASLDAVCTKSEETQRCPPEAQSDIDGLSTQRTLFAVSSGLVAVGGGTTAYLLLANDPTQVSLMVSPTSVGLTGSF